MIATVNRKHFAVLVLLVLAIAGSCWNGFADSQPTQTMASNSSGTQKSDSSIQLSGEELWSMNCQRCHNMRPPTMYSPAQWDIIVHHMRVRANITGSEQRAIADFLKSASR